MRLTALNESSNKELKIGDLDGFIAKSKTPVYILVAGSVGSGKSFVVSKFLPKVDVLDPDDYTMRLGAGVYSEKNVSASIKLVQKDIKDKLTRRETFIQQGTSANFQSTITKLKTAKLHGFVTVLLYVDTPISQAIEQVKKRVEAGGHGAGINSTKVQRTYAGAKLSFRALSGIETDELTQFDLDLIQTGLEKTESTLKSIQKDLDYFVRVKNEY